MLPDMLKLEICHMSYVNIYNHNMEIMPLQKMRLFSLLILKSITVKVVKNTS